MRVVNRPRYVSAEGFDALSSTGKSAEIHTFVRVRVRDSLHLAETDYFSHRRTPQPSNASIRFVEKRGVRKLIIFLIDVLTLHSEAAMHYRLLL